jgi:hypothetical protein
MIFFWNLDEKNCYAIFQGVNASHRKKSLLFIAPLDTNLRKILFAVYGSETVF